MSNTNLSSPYFVGKSLHTYSYEHHLGTEKPVHYLTDEERAIKGADPSIETTLEDLPGGEVSRYNNDDCEESLLHSGDGSINDKKGEATHVNNSPSPSELVNDPSKQHHFANITREGKSKGMVFVSDGQLFWKNTDRKEWNGQDYYAAVYHDDIRGDLIREDAERYANYVVAPASGEDGFDVTSNCDILSQHQWQFDERSQLCKILDGDGNPVFELTKKPERTWPGIDTFMYRRGLLVLDMDDRPVLDLPGIPKCFSSQVEGGRIEAIKRTMPWVQAIDIRARMPHSYHLNGKQRRIPGLTAIRHRQSRFRDQLEVPAFEIRRGTRAKNARYGAKG